MPELGYSVTQSLWIYYKKEVSNLKQRRNKIYPRCVDCDLGLKFSKINVFLKSAPSTQDTGKISLRLKS